MAKQAYWNLLDALIEHPSFVNCEVRNCKRCAKIIELGKEAYKDEVKDWDLGSNVEDLTEDKFKELLDDGFKIKDIAEHFGMTVKQFGDWRRSKGFRVKARTTLSRGQSDAIEIMYKQGKTVNEIAKLFSVSYYHIYGVLHKRDIKLSETEEGVVSVRN